MGKKGCSPMAEKRKMRPRGYYKAWRPIATRWMDNDVYGHVNNVVYYSFFDTAVNAWLVEHGLLDIEKGPVIGLVVETGCTYARPVSFPEEVQAGIAVSRIGNTSVRYEIGLFVKGSSQPAAEGFFVHVYVDREGRRPKPLTAEWKAVLQKIVVPEDG
jgi:acyl-CoA thioester hydrolase